MAFFDFATCRIYMTDDSGIYGGTKLDLSKIPTDSEATMSFSHEYVHFLQLISSLSGFHVLGELIDFGVRSALILTESKLGDRITERKDILGMLKSLPAHAALGNPDLKYRSGHLKDECNVLFGMQEIQYVGKHEPWTIVRQTVDIGTYVEPFAGYVTERGTFRPFTPGLLAESMARRIDQWIKANMGFAAHQWGDGDDEREFYNGIYNLLGHERYNHNVSDVIRERLTVVMCWLALASIRPDEAMGQMLERLEQGGTAGGMLQSVTITLSELLKRTGQLRAHSFNEVMEDIQHGAGNIIRREDYLPVFEQLKKIHVASNLVFSHPGYFADSETDWQHVKQWMTMFSVPPVTAQDGDVLEIDGVECTPTITELFSEISRIVW